MKYTKSVENKMTVETAQLDNQVASFLVGDYNEGQKLAIVDEGVLKYLTSLLPKASTYDIIRRLKDNLDLNSSLEKAVKEAREFVAFHETVNLLRVYFNPKAEIAFNEPFNVVRELTITEKSLRLNELREEGMRLEKEIDDYNKKQRNSETVVVGDPNDEHERLIDELGNK